MKKRKELQEEQPVSLADGMRGMAAKIRAASRRKDLADREAREAAADLANTIHAFADAMGEPCQ